MGQYYLTKHSEPQYPLYTLPGNIITEEVSRLEKTYLKKMLIIGVLAAVAIAIGYPVAVWALTIAKPSSSIAINTNTKESDDSEHEAISIEEINIEGHEKALGNNIIIYEEREHREALHNPKSRTILSAVINITDTNVQSISPGNKVGIVLTKIPTKNGGNYSLLILIHTQDRTYHIVTNNTKVNIGSDKITINGNITRSTHAEFKPGQQITLDLSIGSATLSRSSDSLIIKGDVLALIFKR
jgi:hypothetical protein